jgi:hypothetical protein
MSQTDLIGWGSLALFGVVFALLYRFITTASRRLEKTLGDGRALGLASLPNDSPERSLLAAALAPYIGRLGKDFRLGSVYKTGRGNGYLFSMVEMSKADRPGGESAEHQDHEKVFWRAPHPLDSFVVRKKPHGGPGVDLPAKLPVQLIEEAGYRFEPVESALSAAFRRKFVVYGGATGTAIVPAELQQVLTEACGDTTAAPGRTSNQSGALAAMDEIEGIAFTPDGFLIHLSSRLRSRSLEQLRSVLHLAERIEQAISS